jgi:acyl-CoA synthetase (NDP forming)
MPAPSDTDGVTLPAGAVTLSEAESKTVLASFGVPVTKEVLVAEGEDLGGAVSGLSYPVAVKVVSRDIAHKTEVGGVKLGIADADALKAAASEVLANGRNAKPDAKIDGVLVSEMADGIEVLIGVINDPGFGPTVALGLGGVLTEIMKDITYRVAPFDIETAKDMIAELRAAKMFDGYRGQPAADKAALADMLVSVSRMAAGLEPRLAEMDINPVFVGPAGKGVRAADALVVLK